MKTSASRLALALAFASACATTACLSGPAPVDRFYRLEIPTAERNGFHYSGTPLAGRLVVKRFRTDGLTDERNLLFRSDANANEIQRYPYQRWVAPPSSMLQADLAAALGGAGVAESVVTSDLRVETHYTLSGRIVRLEQIRADPARIVLDLEFALTRRADRELLFQKRYREELSTPSALPADAAAGYGQALGRVLEKFLADLARVESGAHTAGPSTP